MIILKYGENIDVYFENFLEAFCFNFAYSNRNHFLDFQEFLLKHSFINEKDKMSFEEYQEKFKKYYF